MYVIIFIKKEDKLLSKQGKNISTIIIIIIIITNTQGWAWLTCLYEV